MMNRPLPTIFSSVLAVGDPSGERTVLSLVAILVAIGVALVMVAVWMFKTTRPDAELLAPLEVMGDRAWRRGDAVWQRRRLDEVRPPNAAPLKPSAAPPALDAEFEAGPTAPGFDDFEPKADGPVDRPPPEVPVADADAVVPTPTGISRVDLDAGLDDGAELQPEVLAAAMAELDAQLGERPADHDGEQSREQAAQGSHDHDREHDRSYD